MKLATIILILAAGLIAFPAASSAYDPEMGLRTFDTAWKAVQSSYYDSTFAGMNWDSLGAAYRTRAESASSESELREILNELMNSLGDSHFAVLSRSPLSMEATLSWEETVSPSGLKVGVIRFDGWMLNTSQAFDRAMDALRHKDGLVVDLRGNPGGMIPMIMGVSGHFLPGPELMGTLYSRKNTIEVRANPRRIDTAGDYVEPYAGPLAILVDARSYSASEFFAAGMQALGRAAIVGEPTTGAALGATYTMLPNGDVLEHAVTDFVAPSGVRVEGTGVQPNLPAAADPLAAALEWMDARAIVDRYVEAVGGADAFEACRGRRITGTMSLPGQGISGELRMFAQAPQRMLMEITLPGMGELSTGFNGETGWIIQPMVGPMLLEGKALEQLKVQARYDEPRKMHPEVERLERMGSKRIGDRDAHAVKTVYRGGFEVTEFYDQETGLTLGFEGEQETPMGTLNVFTTVRAHGPCGPLLIPTISSQELMGMEQVIEITACECVDVPDSVFALPPVIQTLKTGMESRD